MDNILLQVWGNGWLDSHLFQFSVRCSCFYMHFCLNFVHIYSLVSHQALASLAGSGVAKGVEGVAGCAASHGNGHLVIAKILLRV